MAAARLCFTLVAKCTKQDYKDTVNYIMENVKLLDVIDGYGLKPRKEIDERHTMMCPFHTEDTPSLKIYDNKSFFCFGCGAGYGVIDFIKLYEGISFMDVINRYKDTSGQSSAENIYQKILDYNRSDNFNLPDYMLSSQFRMGIILREYLNDNNGKKDFVDKCFYDMDNFFEDAGNLNKEKIDYFEDLILERITNEIR